VSSLNGVTGGPPVTRVNGVRRVDLLDPVDPRGSVDLAGPVSPSGPLSLLNTDGAGRRWGVRRAVRGVAP
jgi:hypothetical protein